MKDIITIWHLLYIILLHVCLQHLKLKFINRSLFKKKRN